jgi:hypothetical protein
MTNEYGVDVEYFKKELKFLSNTLFNRTQEELFRYLICLAKVACPDNDCDELPYNPEDVLNKE